MKKAKQADLKPLLEVLAGLNCDGRTKSLAYNFLRTDLSRLDSDESFRKAFAGLIAAEQLLAPLHPNYARCLDSMRKSLMAFQKSHYDMTPAQWRVEIPALWKECCGIFRRFCPPDEWRKVEEWTERLWKDLLR